MISCVVHTNRSATQRGNVTVGLPEARTVIQCATIVIFYLLHANFSHPQTVVSTPWDLINVLSRLKRFYKFDSSTFFSRVAIQSIERKLVLVQTCRQSICRSVFLSVCLLRHVSQRVSLIVVPDVCMSVCLSVCLSVCRSFRDLQPTTIDRSQPNLVCRYIPVLAPV